MPDGTASSNRARCSEVGPFGGRCRKTLLHDGSCSYADSEDAIPNSIDRPESIIEPNSAYKLGEVCPTGKHVGVVHAHIAGGRMVLDQPPVYVCGCYYVYK